MSREIIHTKSKSKESKHGMSLPKVQNISYNSPDPLLVTLQDSQLEWQFSIKSGLFLKIICWALI